MKNIKFFKLLIIIVLALTYNIAKSQTSYNFTDGLNTAKSSGKIAVVGIIIPGDNWCGKMESVYSAGNISGLLNTSFVFIKLNAQGTEVYKYNGKDYKASELAKLFEATGYPSHAFLGSDGSILKFKYNGEMQSSFSGYLEAGDFEKLLNFFSSGKYKTSDLSKEL